MCTNEELYSCIKECYYDSCTFEETLARVVKRFPYKSFDDEYVAKILTEVIEEELSLKYLDLDNYKNRNQVLGYIKDILYCDEDIELFSIGDALYDSFQEGAFTVDSLLRAVKEVKR